MGSLTRHFQRRRPAPPPLTYQALADPQGRALAKVRTVRPAHAWQIAPTVGDDRYPGAARQLAVVTGQSADPAPQPMLAAVVGAQEYMAHAAGSTGMFRSRRGSAGPLIQDWERRVFRWIREGPGFVGAAATMYADWLSSNAKLVVQERSGWDDDGGPMWERSDFKPALELLAMWRGLDESQADLVKRLIFYCDSVGQCYQSMGKTSDRWWYRVHAHTVATLNPQSRLVEFRGAPDAEPGHHAYQEADPRLVDHLFLANDPEWWAVPTSQLRRVIGEIEWIMLCHRATGRDLNSRVVANGMVHFPASPGAKDWTRDFAEWAQEAMDTPEEADQYHPGRMRDVVQGAPFPVQCEGEPSYVSIGRDMSNVLQVHELAWNAFCLGIDAPRAALEGSAEVGSRWSGYLARDENATQAAAPRMQRIATFVEQSHFRPWWRVLNMNRPADQFRIWYELPAPRPDRTSERIEVAPLIVPSRAALAETVGWSKADLVELPPGMTEAEFAYAMRHGASLDSVLAQGDKDASEADQANSSDPANGPPAEFRFQPGGPPAGQPPRLAPGVREPREPTPPDPAREAGRPEPEPIAASFGGGPRPYPGEVGSWGALIPAGSS